MITVTKPFLPPSEEYEKYLAQIWQNQWLTNNGPLVKDLEKQLQSKLGLENLLFVNNGTIAIQLALKALKVTGEVITTPFSYVATTSSIVWEGLKPVFVDIKRDTLNIDETKIKQAITDQTSAILATHVFGNPCNIDRIQEIADRHGLKVIYDAAHCFGSKYRDKCVLGFGDISTISFHATKVYHSIEGGALVTHDPELNRRLSLMRNFGHNGVEKFDGVGINGKNSEFHAAMGLVNLDYIDQILKSRREQSELYHALLADMPLTRPELEEDATGNDSYYPVIFQTERIAKKVLRSLEQKNVFARRYFYPSLSKLDYVADQITPVSDDISGRILCLPVYVGLSDQEIEMICSIIIEALGDE
jgi:dTDP-4-amino-4,6-dideoxygalactose transaminase